jgi:hypothetical protein
MAFQKSVAVRNAELDAIETTAGTTALLKLFSGAEPANCAAADPAGLLATLTLPSDWMAAAGSGVKAKAGTWSGTGSAAGTIACWRIYDNAGTTCHLQGNTTDMTFDNTNVAIGQVVTVNTFSITAGNA